MNPLTPDQICTKPPADLVRAVRERHGYTQVQCAYIVGCYPRTWQRYEQRDGAMDLAIWWCFLLRIAEITPAQLPPIPPRQRAGVMVHLAPG